MEHHPTPWKRGGEPRQWAWSIVCTRQNLGTGISQRCQTLSGRRVRPHPGHSINPHPPALETSSRTTSSSASQGLIPARKVKGWACQKHSTSQAAAETGWADGCGQDVLLTHLSLEVLGIGSHNTDPAKIPTASPSRGWPGLLPLSEEAADLQDGSRPQFQAQSGSQAGCRLGGHPHPCRGSVQVSRAGNGMNTGMTGPSHT